MIGKCCGAYRHWFTYYGMVGSSAPTCRRCGAPNPRYKPSLDPDAEPESILVDSDGGSR